MTERRADVDAPAPTWTVCSTCHDLRGPIREDRTTWQRCHCQPHPDGSDEQRWDRHDFNRELELCRTCGLIAMPSGSRWSVWLCTPCKKLARTTNNQSQRIVVPIGRHSLMHGIGVAGADVDVPGETARFTAASMSLFEAQGALGSWGRHRVAYNLDVIGRSGQDIDLGDYADDAAAHGLTPDSAFFAYLQSLQ